MPVLFTLDLPTNDEAEAQRWASLIREVRCDLHGDPPARVRVTPGADHLSVFTTGCCPQLYTAVTDRLRDECGPREAVPDPEPA